MIEIKDLFLFLENNFKHLDMVFVLHCQLTDSTIYLLEFEFGFFKVGRYEVVESVFDHWIYQGEKQATLFSPNRIMKQSEIDLIWDRLQKESVASVR